MLSKALLYTWYFGMLARLRAASIENFCNPVTSPLSPNRFRYPARVTVLPASCWWYGMHFFYTSLPLLLTEYNYSMHWVKLLNALSNFVFISGKVKQSFWYIAICRDRFSCQRDRDRGRRAEDRDPSCMEMANISFNNIFQSGKTWVTSPLTNCDKAQKFADSDILT